jgi:O-methyltransferase
MRKIRILQRADKNNVVIRRGIFPNTAKDIDDSFIFVRLDLDLYQPTLEGLKFFYPRMCRGGVILVHDYYTESYAGVKQAVIDFWGSDGVKHLHKLPAGDLMSLAIVGF